MKKFKFNIRGSEYDVSVMKIEGTKAKIEVNGTHYDVDIQQEMQASKTPTLVRSKHVASHEFDKAKTSKPTDKKGAGFIKAPLPGTILEMKVKEGDEVKIGDTLLIMEAMKMENDIKTDKQGKVQSIKVNVGDSVLEGEVLVEIGG